MKQVRTIFAVLILLVGGYWLYTSHTDSGYSVDDTAYNKDYWQQQITHKGAEETYATFKEKNARVENTRQHLSAHVMGELLYKEMGEKGIAICDASFSFGCYHGFFGRAIAEGGEDLIVRLDAVCVEAFGPMGTGCQHGMGHGILEYVGYERITDALALCKNTTQLVPLLGCTSGVFMEYNTPLAGIADGLVPKVRTFDPAHPYEPCTDVLEEYRKSCYFELGNWYLTRLADPSEAGNWCAGLTSQYRLHCFLGLGSKIAHSANYEVPASVSSCSSFTDEDVLSCRAGVSWSLFSNRYRPAFKEACQYEDETDAQRCRSLADFTHGRDPLVMQ